MAVKESSASKIKFKGVDALFGLSEEQECVREIPLDELDTFKNHPFKVFRDDKMEEMIESISEYGVLVPGIARPSNSGEKDYELVVGHRRKYACRELGLKTMPVIIRDMSDDEATVVMVDSNIQRENLLYSEKAFAYRIASVVCEHNIDYIDTFGIGIDKEELYNYESTMIIGAGSFPGLSGILPVWIRKEQQESEIRRVNIFAGGNEHITASACADFLLSTFSQFGKIDSYYSHQQIKKTENITERVPLIFPDTAEIMEYLPDEIYLSAEYSRIDELHWYNVQTNSEYRNIIQEALLKLMISQEYEYVNRLAENVKRKLENKREESKTWYRIWLEIETVTEKKNYGYEALDSYKINGRIAAFCAEALCSGIRQKGIYWPFEILDAEIVMNSLINEEILIGLKENDKKMQEHDLNYEEGEL